jgi:hypothetical protein
MVKNIAAEAVMPDDEKKIPWVRVGFETWQWAPNTELAIALVRSSMTADMTTWHEWGKIEAFEDPDGQLGHVFDYVWEALDIECPRMSHNQQISRIFELGSVRSSFIPGRVMDDEGHGKSCRLCRGGGMYTPDWPVPEYPDGWPEWEDTAMKQGWSNDTVKKVALGFISESGIMHKFERYCKQLADEENAQMEEKEDE